MPVRIGLAAGDGFLALALRRIAAGSPELTVTDQARQPDEAVALLAAPGPRVVVMAGALLAAGGEALRQALATAQAPVVLVGGDADPGGRVRRVDAGADLGVLRTRVLAAIRDAAGEPAAAATSRPEPRAPARRYRPEVVLIGSSTGGPDVLRTILGLLARPVLPVVIAQHMAADQTNAFALHLAAVTGLPVACRGLGPLPDGESVTLLPGGSDWRLEASGGGLRLRQTDIPGNHFHPSIDALFSSAAATGLRAAAVVLTGMGRDGAEGARRLADTGAPVLVQAPAGCAVAGMPLSVMAVTASAEPLEPASIAARLNDWRHAARRDARPDAQK
jgi:two-component system chemotaxis response regulator CheB